MRLLILDQFSDLGGAQQGLLEFLPSVKQRGWSAVLGFPGDGQLFRQARELGFDVARIRCGPYRSGDKSFGDMARFALGTPVLASQIHRLALKSRAELVYINGPRLLPAAALAGLRVPVVFHSHSYLFPGRVRRSAGAALKACRGWLIGCCHFVTEPWRPYVPRERQFLIYNGVAGPVGPRPMVSRPPSIACIGRIAPEKGQREFVAAASIIQRSLPGCRSTIFGAALFGEAAAARYDAEVRAAGAREGIGFSGWIADVYPALAQTDLLLVPSAAHEATTRVILEAHAAGVPVIAFRAGGIPEVIEHGWDGWLADSTGEMAQLAIDLLRRTPAELAQISRQARESWERRFTLQRYHQELMAALERAAG